MLEHIVSQHLVESGALWQVRQSNIFAPHWKQDDLRRIESRIEAHLDGLRIAGEEAVQLVTAYLDDNSDSSGAFVYSHLCFAGEIKGGEEQLRERVLKKPAMAKGIAAGICWTNSSTVDRVMARWLGSNEASHRLTGLNIASFARLNPGLDLEKCLFDKNVTLRAEALRIVGTMGYGAWAKQLKSELRSQDLACRFSAAWSLARLNGDPAAIAELQTITLAESTYRIPALHMLIRRLDPGAARKLITMLSKIPGAERLVLFAIGVWGDPVDVPFLLEKMKQTPYARIAAESFTFITGLNLAENNFDGPIPEDHEPLPNEDPLDDRVEMDPDENLPWPIVEKIHAWWNANRSRFREGTRYLVGEPLSETRCNQIVLDGYQRQRAYAALELAIQHPGQPMIDITARQK